MFPQWNIPQQWESTIYSYVPQQEWILDKRCKLKRLDMDWKLCCSKIHILKPQPQCDDIWEVKSGYMRSWGWSSMIKGRDWNLCFLSLSLSLSAMWEHSRKAATCEPGRQPSLEPDHAGTLISNFQPPEMGENTFRLFRQQKRWHVVMAAQADQDRKNTRAEKLYLASKQKLPDKQEVKQKHDL